MSWMPGQASKKFAKSLRVVIVQKLSEKLWLKNGTLTKLLNARCLLKLISFFHKNLEDVFDEYGEQFHQNIFFIKNHYERKCSVKMLAESMQITAGESDIDYNC